MQEKKNNYNPLGICQRLFDFLIYSPVARGFKRITLGQPLPQAGSTKQLLDDSLSPAKLNEELMVNFKDHENSNHDLGSDIQVLFKHSEGFEYWTSVDKFADQSQMQKGIKVNQVLNKPQEKVKAFSAQNQGKRSQVVEPNSTTAARSRDPKKIISTKDTTKEEKTMMKGKSREPKESEEEEKNKMKGKSIPSENSRLATQNEEPKMTPRRLRPPLGVAPNINEKSEDFIKRRKKAMGVEFESKEPKDLN